MTVGIRVGQGFDVHVFGEGDHLVLGGVRIPYVRGFIAHSDGDVLLHAICDALLGAMAMGDIGNHFPDTAAEYENIDSRILLRHIHGLMVKNGYRLGNLDATIIAQEPKMAPHISSMCANIASDLHCAAGQVNVKATTTEKAGFTGRKEGIACQAICLLTKAESSEGRA